MARCCTALGFALLAIIGSGCGEGGGVAEGAAVNAYVAAPLCAAAKGELASEGARAGGIDLRVVCLASTRKRGELSLATVGANARRATEDSAAIAYVEAPGPAARFARPIVEEAGIAVIVTDSGKAAVVQLLRALTDADSGSLRDSVREGL